MKIKSRIKTTSDHSMDVIFGGAISYDLSVGLLTDEVNGEHIEERGVKLSLYELCHPVAIGEERDVNDNINPRSPQVGLVFRDADSIDSLILSLEATKEELLDWQREGRGERRKRNRDGRKNREEDKR